MQTYISTLPRPEQLSFPRTLCILGSTGSIGTNTLRVVEDAPEKFRVLALAGGRNAKLLAEQAVHFRPAYLCVLDDAAAKELAALLPADYAPEILTGPKGYCTLATLDEVDVVLSSIVGAAGLPPTYAAVKAGKIVALANKESLVLAGHLIREECRKSGAVILPVDSEHNALFQVVCHEDARTLKHLLLTASGGPFRAKDAAFLENVTREQALNHPNWSMGAKISIDSASLMNKGLEVIEACHLYGLDEKDVLTVVHPQSIVHSLAEFVDGSILAHLGPADMRVAIAHCLAYPERLKLSVEPIDLIRLASLTFEEPKLHLFPCLRLAREAYRAGASHPVVLNAANEVAVDLFLKERIAFLDIPRIIERALEQHRSEPADRLDDILDLDARTRERTLAHHG
ncbi:MAG: 1-deoxy-D-xylulose-5-phosphate reductoisomerase [Desulfovibrio sp.]|uniref:1-deoxy-D-xylulose-5-phosphate reductoisomerase n=1 Tax=Desulfovibrio sp. 7SRBS1 TaxID=3378064 RepID=UPI003B3F8871